MSGVDEMARECLGVRLRLLERAVTRIYDDALRPHELRVGQLNLLATIGTLGEARPGQLCQLLHMERSTVSRDCQRLVDRGWLTATPGEEPRSLLYRLTSDGTAAVDACLNSWRTAQESVRRFLGEHTCTSLQKRTDELWREA